MGNAESVSIEIKVDGEEKDGCPLAYAGTVLEGKVIVNVKKIVEAAPIKLIMSGKEKTGLKVRKRDQMVFTDAERRFFSVTIPLRSFQENRRVGPGEYTFPFSLRLPRSLPGSDRHPNDRRRGKIGYQIQYRMTAKMGKLYKELYFDMQSAPISRDKIPCLIRPTQHQMQSLGMSKQGQVVLGAMVNNSIVGRGKNIELFLACRNDSTANIRCVEIQIVEFVRWSLGPLPETTDSHKVIKSVKSVSLPSTCKAKKSSEVGTTSTGDMYREIYEELRSRRDPILVSVPEIARDTYKGRLINVWHCLKIRFMTRGFTNDATAIIPIQIGTPPLRHGASGVGGTPGPLKYPMKHPQPGRGPSGRGLGSRDNSNMSIESTDSLFHSQVVPIPVAAGRLTTVDENSAGNAGGNMPHVVIAPEDLIILGSSAINRRDSRADGSDAASVVTAPPEQSLPVEVSLRSLLTSMETAVNDFDLIMSYLMDRRWVKLFGRVTPAEYGAVVAAVKIEVDQPRVAVMLAPHLNGGGSCFTCEYGAEAVRNCSVSYRSVTTKRLLPMCIDVKQKYKLILNELNEWERIATSNEFEQALIAVGQ